METTIKKIHDDFDQAVETLERISNEKQQIADSINQLSPDNDYEKGLLLSKLGFKNNPLVKKVVQYEEMNKSISLDKSKYSRESQAIKETVKFYKMKFPFYKFILYSQVINICEKYNLYLAHSAFYKGEIPEKNIQDLKRFPLHIYEDNEFRSYIPTISKDEPLSSHSINYSNYSHTIDMYICAPYKEFDTTHLERIGQELFEKSKLTIINPFKFKVLLKPAPKDPIILLPVLARELRQIGFIVVTKWGLEANDENLIVAENN